MGSDSPERLPSTTSQYSSSTSEPIRSMPSRRPSFRLMNTMVTISVTASSAGISRRRVTERTEIGVIRAVIPSTSPMLAMFEPIALPAASSGSPLSEAVTDTKISGPLVAMPTSVRPMSSGGTPRLRAVLAAPITKRSAPQMSRMKPASVAAV
jgi:hypothetical protein